MPNKPDKKQKHLDSTNLGSELTTTWVEEPNALDEATVRQLEAADVCREALGELLETILAWTLYLCRWNGIKILYFMTSNHANSLVEKLGTQTVKALACLENLEKANQELDRAIAETEFDSLEHLRHWWADKESKPSAEPSKADKESKPSAEPSKADKESKPSAEPPKGVALEKNPLLLPPGLAAAIGLHEAVVLQQMHYWLSKGAGKLIDGIRWIWNTLDDWLKQFPFLSKWQLRKALVRLRDELKLVEFEQRRKHEWNRTGWYTINYQGLEALQLPTCEQSHLDVRPPTHRGVDCSHVNTETTPEITPEISFSPPTPPKEEEKNQQQMEVEVAVKLGEDMHESPCKDVDESPGFAYEQTRNPAQPAVDQGQDNYSAAGVGFSTSPTRSIKRGQTRKEIWEIAPGRPYPAFLSWKEISYKEQGGHWERNAASFAYSEFYNNRVRTHEILWPQFMAEVKVVTENANQHRANGMAIILPSWFASRRPDPTDDNVRQLMANVEALLPDAKVALPQGVATSSCTQALPYTQAVENSITPLPLFEATLASPSLPLGTPAVAADKPQSRKLTTIAEIMEACQKKAGFESGKS